jgi:hypothetical protein
MTIVIEEVSGEIIPEAPAARPGEPTRAPAPPPSELDDRIRRVLAHERRRVERLSDR